MPDHPKYSIVIPIYNEEETIPELHRRMAAMLDGLDGPGEMIFVNDGSRDNSLALLRELAGREARVRVLSFSRNFGHQIAITAGIDYAAGEAVVVIDADLQDPPEVIPELIKEWQAGAELVYAVRAERKGETFFKKATASAFYRLIASMTELKIPPDAGDFRLMDRKVVDALKRVREHHRFMRGLSVWVGFKQKGVTYVRHERYAGSTKYPLRKMIRFATDGITSFSYVPLQLATTAGFIFAGIALVAIPIVAILRLWGSDFFGGQATTLISVLLLGGVQLIFLGIIGEYLGRIYNEVKQRPLYLISEEIGFDATARERARAAQQGG